MSTERRGDGLKREQKRRVRGLLAGGLLAGILLAAGSPAFAQTGVLPGDSQVEPPPFEDPAPAPSLELPPAPPLSPEEERRPSSASLGYVSRIVVEGSTVFGPAELDAATAPFVGRLLATEELFEARDAVTALYREHGYITSGAVLPDQEVQGGVVHFRVIEGRLVDVEVAPTRWFRPGYFRDRLARAGRAPVDVFRLERALQLLQRDPLVERVAARLEPTAVRGESRLVVEVVEGPHLGLDLAASNERSVSVGEYAGDVAAYAANLIGLRDELHFEFGVADGLQDYSTGYTAPLTSFDTLLGLSFRDSTGEVILGQFEDLDIESHVRSYGVQLEQPFLRDEGREWRLGLMAEYRESETDLRGDEFCTIAGEPPDCDVQVAVLRPWLQYTASTPRTAFAMRAVLSFGLDALGATKNPPGRADGQFFSWLGQLQGVYRLPEGLLGSQLLARLDTQIATDPLVTIEKFSVGGARTVRGYRENQLVRDNGVAASLELRVPVLRLQRSELALALAPFLDVGHAWDQAGPGRLESDTLASLGVGLRLGIADLLRAELYYGGRLLGAERAPAGGLQRQGIHFRVVLDGVNTARAGARSWGR